MHNISTRNKHHFHRPVANLSCFQKGASYCGIRIFNSLPRSITILKNEKTLFKVALKKFLNAHSFYTVDEFFTCTDDTYYWLYDCLNVSFTVILVFLYALCLWHVPHPIVLWFSRIYGMHMYIYVCMYVCMYVLCMYVCMYVLCMYVCTIMYVCMYTSVSPHALSFGVVYFDFFSFIIFYLVTLLFRC